MDIPLTPFQCQIHIESLGLTERQLYLRNEGDDVDSLNLYPGEDASGEGVVKKRRSGKLRRRKGHPVGGLYCSADQPYNRAELTTAKWQAIDNRVR